MPTASTRLETSQTAARQAAARRRSAGKIPRMKTPYTNHWIALDALGPEDEDADLLAYVSVDLDDGDAEEAVADSRKRALAKPPELVRHHSAEDD